MFVAVAAVVLVVVMFYLDDNIYISGVILCSNVP